jgi:hypothetical protein
MQHRDKRWILAGVLATGLVGSAQAKLFGGNPGGGGGMGMTSMPAPDMGRARFTPEPVVSPVEMAPMPAAPMGAPLTPPSMQAQPSFGVQAQPSFGGGGFGGMFRQPSAPPPVISPGPAPGLAPTGLGGSFLGGGGLGSGGLGGGGFDAGGFSTGGFGGAGIGSSGLGAAPPDLADGAFSSIDTVTGTAAPTGGYTGTPSGGTFGAMTDFAQDVGGNLWNTSLTGQTVNGLMDAYQQVATPEARWQLAKDVASDQVRTHVLEPLQKFEPVPHFHTWQTPDGKTAASMGFQMKAANEGLETLDWMAGMTGLNQRFPRAGRILKTGNLPDGTPMGIYLQTDDIHGMARMPQGEKGLFDRMRIQVGNEMDFAALDERTAQGNGDPRGGTVLVGTDVLEHLVARNQGQLVGKQTSIGVPRGFARSTTTGARMGTSPWGTPELALDSRSVARSGNIQVNGAGTANLGILGMVEAKDVPGLTKNELERDDSKWVEAYIRGVAQTASPRRIKGNGTLGRAIGFGNRPVAKKAPSSANAMVRASLNAKDPNIKVGWVEANPYVNKRGLLRSTGVTTPYRGEFYFKPDGMLPFHHLSFEDARMTPSGLVLQTRPGTLTQEAISRMSRKRPQ